MTLSINKSTPTSFELGISNIPTKTMEETKNVTLQIFQTIIPGMDIASIDTAWMGVRPRRDSSGGIDFQDWNINFFVANDFSNWKTLHDWVKYAAEIDALPTSHNVNAILLLRNNFGEEVLKIYFTNVWLKNLGDVQLDTQDGDTILQCSATLDYGRYDAYLPDDDITG